MLAQIFSKASPEYCSCTMALDRSKITYQDFTFSCSSFASIRISISVKSCRCYNKIHKFYEKQLKNLSLSFASSNSLPSDLTRSVFSLRRNLGPLTAMATAPIGAVTNITRTAIVTICMPNISWYCPVFPRSLAVSSGIEPIAA